MAHVPLTALALLVLAVPRCRSRSGAWRGRLPTATAQLLPAWFPNYVAKEVMDRFQLGALSQFASYLDTAALPDITAMLA